MEQVGIDCGCACRTYQSRIFAEVPTENADPEGNQKYTDVLPSFHAKYNVHENANLRFSYARAINRPSFFEIVPYTIFNEDFDERGNPDLKHTVADNVDLRYEFFPKSSERSLWLVCSTNI